METDMEDEPILIKNIIDTIMYYHTALRNVALLSSISIAIFTFSKFFSKDYLYKYPYINIIVRILSIFLLCISILMCYFLYTDFDNLIKKYTYITTHNIINKDNWYSILWLINILLIGLLSTFIFILFSDLNIIQSKNKIKIR